MSDTTPALDEAFERMAAASFELPNGFVNHGAMACEALAVLDCADDIDSWARRSRWMWWWAEVSAGGTRSSGTVIFAMRARHSARRPHRTGASACRTRAVTLLRQPDIVGDPAYSR